MADNGKDGWVIDKRVSLDHLFTPILWVGTIVFFIATQNGRIESLEEQKAESKKFIEKSTEKQDELTIRMTKMEIEFMNLQKLVAAQSTVINRIDRKLPTFKELEEMESK